jgi:hypothetical protein
MPLVPVKDLLSPAAEAILNTDYIVRASKGLDRWTITMAVPGGTWFQVAVSDRDMEKLVEGSFAWVEAPKPKARPKPKPRSKPKAK